jgi:ATP-dependent Clp protease ATP-binding subunit ClpA
MLIDSMEHRGGQKPPFDENARIALNDAQQEARIFGSLGVDVEHIVIGFFRSSKPVLPAHQVLGILGVESNRFRSSVEAVIGGSFRRGINELSLTPRAESLVDRATQRSKRSGKITVSDLDLLDAFAEEGEGVAAGLLEASGVSMKKIRAAVELFESIDPQA